MNDRAHKGLSGLLGRLLKGFKCEILIGLTAAVFAMAAFVPLLSVLAANSMYTITYINGSTTYTKTYAAGSTVTLDVLPSGAIAWTDDNSPDAPNGKLAYVDYSHSDTSDGSPVAVSIPMTIDNINRNITLTANYGSYANGLGPRLIQYHLELKFLDMTNNVMLQYEQHYANTNAPAGYYVYLPPANYFGDGLYAQVNSAGGLVNTGQTIASWADDSSYTGTTQEDASKVFSPGALVYVDPNNYNMIYDAMVSTDYSPDFTATLPPTAPASPSNPTPAPTGTDTVTFRISQVNIPPIALCVNPFANYGVPDGYYTSCGGTFMLPWNSQHDENAIQFDEDIYLEWYSGQAQLTFSGLEDGTAWQDFLPDISGLGYALPVAVTMPGYTFYWQMDGAQIPTDLDAQDGDNTLAHYFNNNGINPVSAIGGSHVFTLQYVPVPAAVQLVVVGHTDNAVYDGLSHGVSGYDVYSCPDAGTVDTNDLPGSGCTVVGTSGAGEDVVLANGDVLNFINTSGNSNASADGVNVGSYPISLSAGDFAVNNASGDVYNITTVSGGLTITKRPIDIVVTPPIDPNADGTQTSTVTPSDPDDLANGQVIVTPNGDGTIIANTGDGDVDYIDPNTGDSLDYDPSKPNGGLVVIVDPNIVDPDTGKPADVTNNYDVNNVLPKPLVDSDNSGGSDGGNSSNGDNTDNSGNSDTNAPDTGVFSLIKENGGVAASLVGGVIISVAVAVVWALRRVRARAKV